jgi:thiamine biosynthesis lipoprotein
MGSPCELLVATPDSSLTGELAGVVAAEAWRIEDKFSRYLPDNVVARINESGGASVTVDDETAGLLDFAATLHELSDGRFDITSGVLRRAWTFDGSDRVPESASVEAILDSVGWHRVHWQRPQIRLEPGMQIDLGGIGKEYAVDRAAGLVAASTELSCLLNFGGDLVAVGPPYGGSGWQVGIESLSREGSAERRIRLKAGALATSGDARRCVVRDGRRYGHILDPRTGWPVEDAPRSVTVAAETCTQAGMLATLAMLQGAAAESWLEEQGVRFWSLRQAAPA